MTRYRFRIRTTDGQEQLSEPIEVAGTSADELRKAPEWSESEFAHGDTASPTVKGAGLEGKKVKFIVEHKG